jgi:hypothetical protein
MKIKQVIFLVFAIPRVLFNHRRKIETNFSRCERFSWCFENMADYHKTVSIQQKLLKEEVIFNIRKKAGMIFLWLLTED